MFSDTKMLPLSFAKPTSNLNVNLIFENIQDALHLNPNDSLLVIGKPNNLKFINSSQVLPLLNGLNIPDSWFNESISYLTQSENVLKESSESDSSLIQKLDTKVSWLNKLIIETLPGKCSRNNTPSRAHYVTKIINRNLFGNKQVLLIVCEETNAIAYVPAISRAFPVYSQKTINIDTSESRIVQVLFLYINQGKIVYPNNQDIECFNILSKSVRLTARIIDTPCAEMTTDHFLDEINLVANELGIKPFVIEGEELKVRGFGGLYNVGKAAVNSPKLVVLSSLVANPRKTVAWIGKGIVFDTGGLCIKSRQGMCSMKRDCGGAATVLGAFYTAVKLGFQDNLHAVFCLAENAVNCNSYRPDDIIKLYSGKTVEITNTDAEGRLVLGDGVAFAKKDLKANVIIDMATLTGAQGPATGRLHGAVLTNNEKWEKACVEIGKRCGDLCFPIVFAPEIHFSEFKSEVADMTNSVKNSNNAASACAGLFIHSHLGKDYKGVWIHFDIAAPVEEGDRATGYGVALLNSLFGESCLSPIIRKLASKEELPLKNESDEE